MSYSLRPHEVQHIGLPCPSQSPRACSNSCPLSQWCHPTISSSVISFSSCLQSFPASQSFPMVSSSHQVARVLECQLQHQSFRWYSGLISFRTDWFDLLAAQGILQSIPQYHISKASIPQPSPFFMVQLSHPYMTIGNIIALIILNFFSKVLSLLLKMLLGLS